MMGRRCRCSPEAPLMPKHLWRRSHRDSADEWGRWKWFFFSFWIRWHRFFGGLGYRSLNHLVWVYPCIPISYHVDELCILCQKSLDALRYPAGTSSFWVLRIWESPSSEPKSARCSFWKATKVGILASADTGGGVGTHCEAPILCCSTYLSGWWFGTFFIFPYIGNNHPNWLSYFFRGVAQPPTRYMYIYIYLQ